MEGKEWGEGKRRESWEEGGAIFGPGVEEEEEEEEEDEGGRSIENSPELAPLTERKASSC